MQANGYPCSGYFITTAGFGYKPERFRRFYFKAKKNTQKRVLEAAY